MCNVHKLLLITYTFTLSSQIYTVLYFFAEIIFLPIWTLMFLCVILFIVRQLSVSVILTNKNDDDDKVKGDWFHWICVRDIHKITFFSFKLICCFRQSIDFRQLTYVFVIKSKHHGNWHNLCVRFAGYDGIKGIYRNICCTSWKVNFQFHPFN